MPIPSPIRAAGGVALLAAAAAAGAPAPAQAETARTVTQGPVITVSCYRGPWPNRIIVDRPNPVFVESLRAYGFSYDEAWALGQRICTDPAFLKNLEGSKETIRAALRSGLR